MTSELAINGGAKIRNKPLVPQEHHKARFGDEEKKALADVIDSGNLCRVMGGRTGEFEKEAAEYFNVKAAAASTSGTAAIHCALAALDIGCGDEVITSPITDMGSVIPIIAQNAVPVFADVDSQTFNITAETIEKVISDRTKAVIVVHLAGQSCVMEPILKLAKERGIFVIEDCAQSYLSTCDGQITGTIGDIGCFSMNDFKHITCGDGGFVISNNEDFVTRARLFADKGYPRTGPVRNSIMFGVNYRMTELQAAVASVQLKKLESIIERRRAFTNKLNELLESIDCVNIPYVADGIEHSRWFYAFTIDSDKLGVDAAMFAREVTAEGIPVMYPYLGLPVYLFDSIRDIQICDSKMSFQKGLCPVAEDVLDRMMVLPSNEFMADEDARDIADALKKVCDYHLKK
ncbi:DegT/DnrJ/EryC1/StrS family aminotransferase [bacterium]|nr:DegT/DnrJ/EryC1/StrS family aminotransferase [bacterium]